MSEGEAIKALRSLNQAAITRLADTVDRSESPRNTHQQATYLAPVLVRGEREKTFALAVETLKGVDFDTIAVRGVSGLLMGPTVAVLANKELLVVRKPRDEERSTSYYRVEGHVAIRRYVIVDDLMSSGSTVAQIIRAVKMAAPRAELVGVLLYSDSDGVTFNTAENSSKVRRAISHADDPDFVPCR